jgi:hypothetical protein
MELVPKAIDTSTRQQHPVLWCHLRTECEMPRVLVHLRQSIYRLDNLILFCGAIYEQNVKRLMFLRG